MPGDVELACQIDERRRRYEMSEAESSAREAIARFPDSVELSITLGRVLLATHRAAEAAQVFLGAEQLAPSDDRPPAWRIAALSRQRMFGEAIAAGGEAVDRFPDSPIIRVALGRVFLDSSRPEQALEHLANTASVQPHEHISIKWHAATLAELHRWAEAESVIQKVIEKDPDEIEPRFQLGRILYDDSRFTRAIECFESVLARMPEHPKTLEWRTTVLRGD